jgi:pimeloyl-ACP methyl ester carboxylesterase
LIAQFDPNETVFLFVHDAWHGAWEWDEVLARIEEHGLLGAAVDLPGHGSATPAEEYSLRLYTDAVLRAAGNIKAETIILVGHGTAGPVLQLATERWYEAKRPTLVGLIFAAAFILENGESIFDQMPPEMSGYFRQLAEQHGDNKIDMRDMPEYWQFSVLNDEPRRVAELLARLTPEPLAPFEEKIRLTNFFTHQPPCVYISFNEDISLPPGEFHPRMSNRLGVHRHFLVNAGHAAPLTKPREVAEAVSFLSSMLVTSK